uniref:Sulfotransferase n=1 Tax=Astyanax mexicanus TaxID=7994 RepID=A0A8B9L4H1_ASTMX
MYFSSSLVSMTHYFTDNWENVQNFKARPDDIVVATYPKAGRYLYDHVKRSFRCQLAQIIVYCARNAKDNAVSYFHFDRMEKLQPEPGDWSSFLQRFREGKMVFGSWFDHVCGWWEKKQTYSNIHYMFFEDMVEVRSLFLHEVSWKVFEEKEKIRGDVQFDVMKANPMTNLSEDGSLDFSVSQFLRKGKVGDWKNHFTVAQNEQFDELYKQKMKNTTLQFRTEI